MLFSQRCLFQHFEPTFLVQVQATLRSIKVELKYILFSVLGCPTMRLQPPSIFTRSLLSPKVPLISALCPLPRYHLQPLAWASTNAITAPRDTRRLLSYTTSWKEEAAEPSKVPKRKPRKKRGPTAKASLGRIALEAELSQRRNVNIENRSELREASKVCAQLGAYIYF